MDGLIRLDTEEMKDLLQRRDGEISTRFLAVEKEKVNTSDSGKSGIIETNTNIPGLGSDKPELYALLRACLQIGADELWAEFIYCSQPLIAGVILNSVRRWLGRIDPSVVDDLVQETYLKLFANNAKPLRDFKCDHANAIYGFLKVVASRVVHDHFRSRSKKRS